MTALDGTLRAIVAADRLGALAGDVGYLPVVSSWRARVLRCRRALKRLREGGDHKSASVLYVAHGYPDPLVHHIPELGRLGAAIDGLFPTSLADPDALAAMVEAQKRAAGAPVLARGPGCRCLTSRTASGILSPN